MKYSRQPLFTIRHGNLSPSPYLSHRSTELTTKSRERNNAGKFPLPLRERVRVRGIFE